MKWFKHVNNGTTIDEINRQYRKLAMKLHPDLGGSDEEMAELNAEYRELYRRFSHVHEGQGGGTYEREAETSSEWFTSIVDFLIRLGDVDFEIIGSWVWVGGNTRAHTEELKAQGFRWAGKKQRWYKAPDERRRRRSNMTLDEVRERYGQRLEYTANRSAIARA